MKLKNDYTTIRSALAKHGIGIGRPIDNTANIFDVITLNGNKVRDTCCKVFMNSSISEVEREYQLSCKCYEHDPEHFMKVYDSPISFKIENTISDDYKKNGYAMLMEKGIPFTFAPGPKYVSFYIKLLLDLCKAVQTVHSLGYIHMDISPDNVVINNHGHYCLINFGISKVIDGVVNLYNLSGSRYFMAPEVCKGRLSPQADIYGIGMIMRFVLMDGTVEFPASPADIKQIYIKKRELAPIKANDEYANQFLSIINKATNFHSSSRYRNIDEILDSLSCFNIEKDIRFYSNIYEYDGDEAV